MKTDLRKLLDQLEKAPLRTKLTAAGSLIAFVAVLAVGGVIVSRPHFVKLYANLGDTERVAVEKALASAKVSYRVSDFPGPFVVWVDESRYDEAQIAVALASGLAQAPRGIDAASTGASTIFMSAGERAQSMQKREWQECEHLLEKLDFVESATVTTSMPETSPLRAKKPVMVSVALGVRGTSLLSTEQAQNVAKLVCNRFGVPPENVVITDQTGRMLYDATASDDQGARTRDLFEHAASHDSELAAKANEQIAAAFGKRKALVTVTSQWNYDQTTTVDEKIDPKTVAMTSDTRKTSTPAAAADEVGGPTGVASNLAGDFGNGNAAVPKVEGKPAKPDAVATTQDEKKVFEASRSKTQTVHSTPKLERLFVSLVVDESLALKKDEIQSLVEAAVGFDKTRRDVIGVSTTTIAADAPVDPAAPGEVKPVEGPSETTRMLLERGVQIVSAIGFLVVLALSLKGGKKSAAGAAGARVAAGGEGEALVEPEIDPEALARAQIEELVQSDPRRVGEILSRWVDDRPMAGTRR
jgi:flagellar biosynthesis/type III secretory pathway M-ring protein FliF/YscJ